VVNVAAGVGGLAGVLVSPQLLETNLAPSDTAEFSAVYRAVSLALLASTRVM
jgi:hypothetical protein